MSITWSDYVEMSRLQQKLRGAKDVFPFVYDLESIFQVREDFSINGIRFRKSGYFNEWYCSNGPYIYDSATGPCAAARRDLDFMFPTIMADMGVFPVRPPWAHWRDAWDWEPRKRECIRHRKIETVITKLSFEKSMRGGGCLCGLPHLDRRRDVDRLCPVVLSELTKKLLYDRGRDWAFRLARTLERFAQKANLGRPPTGRDAIPGYPRHRRLL